MQEDFKINSKVVGEILENKNKEYQTILNSLINGVNNTEYQQLFNLNKNLRQINNN